MTLVQWQFTKWNWGKERPVGGGYCNIFKAFMRAMGVRIKGQGC